MLPGGNFNCVCSTMRLTTWRFSLLLVLGYLFALFYIAHCDCAGDERINTAMPLTDLLISGALDSAIKSFRVLLFQSFFLASYKVRKTS